MQNLLEELYKTDINLEKFHFRKVFLDSNSYQINGITQSGKTKILKNYLLSLKKNTYLYIDCLDTRLDIELLNIELRKFCITNRITTLVLDNYRPEIKIIKIHQLIISSEIHFELTNLTTLRLYPLDYEEFLAYEHKYNSTALNHYIQLGGLPSIHTINPDERNLYIQKVLKLALEELEFKILIFCAKMLAQKVSPFAIYERLRQHTKVSKDKLYKSFQNLTHKQYIYELPKIEHLKATKKIYLCDISLKSALSIDKNFGRLFENMVYLELLKSGNKCFYDDEIDFYIQKKSEVILCKPFTDERSLFKKIQKIEAFIITYQIKKVTAVTINREGSVSHPVSKIEMIPFDIWVLGD